MYKYICVCTERDYECAYVYTDWLAAQLASNVCSFGVLERLNAMSRQRRVICRDSVFGTPAKIWYVYILPQI